MIRYTIRPAYGSKELLIELTGRGSSEDLSAELFPCLFELGAKKLAVSDLWMNDEVLITFKIGDQTFDVTIDTMGGGFIMAKEHQKVIQLLDHHFKPRPEFSKYFVDHDEYK